MTPAQRHREAVFRRHADEYERVTCYFADEGDCRGQLQSAHIIAAQVIRRVYGESLLLWQQGERRAILDYELDELLADGRNGVPACSFHHHAHEGPVLHCDPPAAFFEWLADVELDWLFEGRRDEGKPRHIGPILAETVAGLQGGADEAP